MSLTLQNIFKELEYLIDKPHEYNQKLAQALQFLDEKAVVGEIEFINGTPYMYDPTRDKMLSMTRPVLAFARYGASLSNCYLKVGESTTAGQQGLLMPRKGTITALAVKSREHGDYWLEVRKNGSSNVITDVRVINGIAVSDQLNVDFEELDNIQLFIRGSFIDHPIASIEWAWRQ